MSYKPPKYYAVVDDSAPFELSESDARTIDSGKYYRDNVDFFELDFIPIEIKHKIPANHSKRVFELVDVFKQVIHGHHGFSYFGDRQYQLSPARLY